MKIKDLISKRILEHPSLYKDENFEKSKLKVLNSIFFIENLDIALVEEGKECGYLVDPNFEFDKDTGEFIRMKDEPYGKDTYKEIPPGYFDSVVFYVSAGAKPLDTTIKNSEIGTEFCLSYSKEIAESEFLAPRFLVAKNLVPFKPYPFSKRSAVTRVCKGEIYLQEDWMEELVFLCEKTLEYFSDENQFKNDSYYQHNGEGWLKYQKEKIEFLNNFLTKYKK